MKSFAYIFLLAIAVLATGCEDKPQPQPSAAEAQPAPVSLEHKVALIDAGRWIPDTDSAIVQIHSLLNSVAKIYQIPAERAADMSEKARQLAVKQGLVTTNAELLDFALAACETVCTEKQYVDALTQYVVVRSSTNQSDQQATRGLILLQNAGKSAGQ